MIHSQYWSQAEKQQELPKQKLADVRNNDTVNITTTKNLL